MSAEPENTDIRQEADAFTTSQVAERRQRKMMRWRPFIILVAILVLVGIKFLRQHPKKLQQEVSPPPARENLERSRRVQPEILKLRGWEFEPGSIGESLFRFIESGAPDYARTVLVFKNIDFAADTLKGFIPSREKELDDLVAVLSVFSGIRIEIAAHSDQNRDFLLSFTLSRTEAETIKKALVKKGISAERIATRAFGFEFPLTDNISEEAKAQNRRVELLLLEMDLSSSEEESSEELQ